MKYHHFLQGVGLLQSSYVADTYITILRTQEESPPHMHGAAVICRVVVRQVCVDDAVRPHWMTWLAAAEGNRRYVASKVETLRKYQLSRLLIWDGRKWKSRSPGHGKSIPQADCPKDRGALWGLLGPPTGWRNAPPSLAACECFWSDKWYQSPRPWCSGSLSCPDPQNQKKQSDLSSMPLLWMQKRHATVVVEQIHTKILQPLPPPFSSFLLFDKARVSLFDP